MPLFTQPASITVTKCLWQSQALYPSTISSNRRVHFPFQRLIVSWTTLNLDQGRCWGHPWTSHSAGRMLCADCFVLWRLLHLGRWGRWCWWWGRHHKNPWLLHSEEKYRTFTLINQEMIPHALALNALVQFSSPNCTQDWQDACWG